IDKFNTQKEVLVVAEIGNNHEGSYTLAEELIGLAAETGARAVKFQVIRAEYLISPKLEKRFAQLKSFELTYSQFEKLSRFAKEAGLLFLATPFDLGSAEFLSSIVSAFKIASGDNTFYPLIERVAAFGKPVIVSSGLAGLAQIQYVKSLIERIWDGEGINQELAVLHCVASYPVPLDQANLSAISYLKEKLNCTVGYSDHTMGLEAPAIAAALGARIIEKHFTKDKNYSAFRDHQLSADPNEMTLLVQRVKNVSSMLGSGEKVLQECENEMVNSLRRSIAAAQDLPQGTRLSWQDITWVRPGNGLPPGKEHVVLGKLLARPVSQGEPITPDMLQAEEEK
ncbi:MAG TPA: N-acetylneuraminate synthase family protein, partial [archaeon]|nr:N-acetylneuraminate synthase family protein [archaeon]